MTYDADVLVAGAGPSGSLCAWHLADAGIRVILIDPSEFPRDKICGDFVSPIGQNELIRIGLGENEGFRNAHKIFSATIHIDGQPVINRTLPSMDGLERFGRVIPRIILDQMTARAAAEKGAILVTSCRLVSYEVVTDHVVVTCEHKGEPVTYRVRALVGADGSKSVVARTLQGGRTRPDKKIVAIRAYYEQATCHPGQADLFFSSDSFPGYYWFFPTGPDTANAGIGMMLQCYPKEMPSLLQLWKERLARDPALRERLGGAKPAGKIEAFPLRIYNPGEAIVANRVLLTGDAAGLVNAINGEGIQYALQSGRWAAESLIRCLAAGDLSRKALRIYEKTIERELGYDMSVSNLAIQFIRNRHLNRLWIMLLRIMIARAGRDPRYAGIAGGVLAGMVPIGNAIKPFYLTRSLLEGLRYARESRHGNLVSFSIQAALYAAGILLGSLGHAADYMAWTAEVARASLQTTRLYISTGQAGQMKTIRFPDEKH